MGHGGRERTHKEPQHPRYSSSSSVDLPAVSLSAGGEGGTSVGTTAGTLKAAVPWTKPQPMFQKTPSTKTPGWGGGGDERRTRKSGEVERSARLLALHQQISRREAQTLITRDIFLLSSGETKRQDRKEMYRPRARESGKDSGRKERTRVLTPAAHTKPDPSPGGSHVATAKLSNQTSTTTATTATANSTRSLPAYLRRHG